MFEFTDSMLLRIVSDRALASYDTNFNYIDYNETGHNVQIPTHRLPGAEWPKDSLPKSMPVYDKGRVRKINFEDGYAYITVDGNQSRVQSADVVIYIDNSSQADVMDYSETVLKNGWHLKEPENKNSISEYIQKGEQCHFENSSLDDIYINIEENGDVKIWARTIIY